MESVLIEECKCKMMKVGKWSMSKSDEVAIAGLRVFSAYSKLRGSERIQFSGTNAAH